MKFSAQLFKKFKGQTITKQKVNKGKTKASEKKANVLIQTKCSISVKWI